MIQILQYTYKKKKKKLQIEKGRMSIAAILFSQQTYKNRFTSLSSAHTVMIPYELLPFNKIK